MNGRHWTTPIASERGVALVTVMLLLVLTSAILAGFLVTATGDTRLRAVDRSRTQAFYAAHAGLEKLTSDLGDLFAGDFSPSAADLAALEAEAPELENITFESEDDLGYDIAFTPNGSGNPTAQSGTISSGPFQGFIGLLTPYTLTVTSRNAMGAESRLRRTMQTVSIPVFQFGVFSDIDLTFSANGTFNFGGRVHTNGNLFLSAAAGGVLFLAQKVTAVGQIVRTHLANSRTIGTTHNGTVMVNKGTGTCPGTSSPYTACRPLAANEGSLTGNIGSSANNNWMNIFGTYNGYLRNALNGITTLQLPLVSEETGGAPIDLIRRPVAGEAALLTTQRLYSQAAIRILLSDTTQAITNLPEVSTGAPLQLVAPAGYVTGTSPFRPPMAVSSGVTADGYRTPVNTPLIGGFLKVEYRDNASVWHDVTLEWLNRGFTRRNIDRATQLDTNTTCAEPNPSAILRMQRVRQTVSTFNNSTTTTRAATICNTTMVATDYWPLTLYDIREAFNRDGSADANLHMAGIIHYLDLDIANLRAWLLDATGSGPQVINENGNGYALYFSDRRGNRLSAAGNETGEFGWEDFVNGATSNGTPNNTLNDGEDVNGNGTLQLYGATPYTRTAPFNTFTGWTLPFTSAAGPRTTMHGGVNNTGSNTMVNRARVNPTMFFRRALKLTNAPIGSLPTAGLTIASENPVYVEGHYNASTAGWGTTNAPAAILADAITLLSANWSVPLEISGLWYGHGDTRSFVAPNTPADRVAATNTWYRFAALAGKGRNWAQTWESGSFGTDGGVHNFLRLLEWWDDKTLSYRGSLASFFFSRQAVGLFRCCDNVYQLPSNRNLSFDTNFLNPALLPPKTPMFRDINTTGFVQVTRR